MPKALWHGKWYIYNYKRREFMRHRGRDKAGRRTTYWTPGTRLAKVYKNPDYAERMARQLNAELGGMPCQAVGETAARCLEQIDMRDGRHTS